MAKDTSWKSANGGHERLQWARKSSKFETAKDFAESVGMKEGTYRAYERRPDSSKHTVLDDQAAIRFGRKLGVSWEWLVAGKGEPRPDQNVERVVKALEAVPEDRRGAIADAIEALLKTGT
jgi:transcriptional regulator with XRE-family HTH domain